MITAIFFTILMLAAGFLAVAHWVDARRYKGQAEGYAMFGQTGAAISMLRSAEKAEENARLAALTCAVCIIIMVVRALA